MSANDMMSLPETAEPARRGLELRRRPAIVVGGLPTVSLLPTEVRSAARDRSLRRAATGAVLVAVLVAAGATALAGVAASSAQDRLTAANSRATTLSAQVRKFRDVQVLQSEVTIGRAGVKVGSSTEVDWQAQIDAIEADMPSGYVITSFAADAADVFEDYVQGTTPLERPRAATVQMTITADSITDLPPWLRKLRSMPAYADATASVGPGDGGAYEIQLTLHLSAKALIPNAKVAG